MNLPLTVANWAFHCKNYPYIEIYFVAGKKWASKAWRDKLKGGEKNWNNCWQNTINYSCDTWLTNPDDEVPKKLRRYYQTDNWPASLLITEMLKSTWLCHSFNVLWRSAVGDMIPIYEVNMTAEDARVDVDASLLIKRLLLSRGSIAVS